MSNSINRSNNDVFAKWMTLIIAGSVLVALAVVGASTVLYHNADMIWWWQGDDTYMLQFLTQTLVHVVFLAGVYTILVFLAFLRRDKSKDNG